MLGAQRSSLCRWRCRPLMFPRSTRLVFVGVVATAVGIVVGAFVSIVVSFRVVVLVTSLLPLPIVELTCCVRCSCRRASACSWPWPFSAAPYWFCLSRCCRCVLSCGLPSPLPLFIADVFAVCAAGGVVDNRSARSCRSCRCGRWLFSVTACGDGLWLRLVEVLRFSLAQASATSPPPPGLVLRPPAR